MRPDGGDSAGRMNPARPVTRAEGVTLFMRLTKQLQAAGAEVGLDGPATLRRLKTSRLPWSAPRWRWGSGNSSPTASLWGPLYPAH
ncbi:hypothetical protein M5E87_04185 [Flavonifractor plautii]|nr:hypothetical protein M5E87_04185 [Flavonifractor plautii]